MVTTQRRRGVGLLTSSNFFVPQVNLPGSMASFVRPAGIPVPVVAPKSGLGLITTTGYGLGQVDPATLDTLPTPLAPMQPGYIQQTIQDGTVITSRITFPSAEGTGPAGVVGGTPGTASSDSQTTAPGTCPFGTGQFAQMMCSQNFWLLALGVVAAATLLGGRR